MVRSWYGKIALVSVVITGIVGSAVWYNWPEKPAPLEDGGGRPKLAVVLVFDQLRGDYLAKWLPYFGEGGFKRLIQKGAWFTNCHYPYSHTVTAAGHASLLTGCTPRDHGIVGNSWYDRRQHKKVECVTGERGKGPFYRKRPTLGDVLLGRFKTSKVAAMSIKDRSAILLAAIKAQICCWIERSDFVTSDFYDDRHRWVNRFNSSKNFDSWIGQPWQHLRSDLDYLKIAGPDDVRFEADGRKQGKTFPHPTPNAGAVENSPFGSQVLLDFAKSAIVEEKLGQRSVPDLLCISFSSNDLIGHTWGPDSQEVFDMTLRTDLLIKDLLDYLDDKVGPDNYVLTLSADHGICPIPGVAQSRGLDAGYVSSSHLMTETETFLKTRFGVSGWIEQEIDDPHIFLNAAVMQSVTTAKPAEIEKALADHLAQQPGVHAAFTRTQLLRDDPLENEIAEMVRQSVTPDTCGDVVLVLKPYYLLHTSTWGYLGTTHGSPHSYDTHVPLLVVGPGIKPGSYSQLVRPQSMAFILARLLDIDPPEGARQDFQPPEEMWIPKD